MTEDINKVIVQIENNEISLSNALLKSKRIALECNYTDLIEFIRREHDKNFDYDNFPKHRRFYSETYGIFENQYTKQIQEIQLNFEEWIREANIDSDIIHLKDVDFSIPEIENFIEKSETKKIRIKYTSEQLHFLKGYLNKDAMVGWYIKYAVFELPNNCFTQIISTTKSQLVELLISLKRSVAITTDNGELFENGTKFSSLIRLGQLIKNVRSEIILVDGYIDEKTLDFFSKKKPEININILTNSKSLNKNLKLYIENYNSQFKNLEVRTSNSFHDRFLIIDSSEFYHIGASIKDAGNSTFMYTKITEQSIKNSIKHKFDKEWLK